MEQNIKGKEEKQRKEGKRQKELGKKQIKKIHRQQRYKPWRSHKRDLFRTV